MDSPFGIINGHNNCYWNSAIQALYGIPLLNSHLTSQDVLESIFQNAQSTDYNTKLSADFFKRYIKFIDLVNNDKGDSLYVLNPTSLLKAFYQIGAEISSIMPGREEDSMEAVSIIMEMMNKATKYDYTPRLKELIKEESNPTRKESLCSLLTDIKVFPYSYIAPIMGGRYIYRHICTKCKTETKKYESFMNIELHFDAKEDQGNPVNIITMLDRYFKGEKTSIENLVDCDTCKEKTQRIIKKKILYLPYVLVIHLARFIYLDEAKKIDNDVIFPIDKPLNMALYTDVESSTSSCTYKLTSIIQHHGVTPKGGHYTTISRRKGGWHLLDDRRVRLLPDQDDPAFGSLDSNAYILFYSQYDTD